MSLYHERAIDPLDEKWCPPSPRRQVQTVGIYPSEWLARRAFRDMGCPPGYRVCESERGWELVLLPEGAA